MSSADNVSERASNDEADIEIKMEVPDPVEQEFVFDNLKRVHHPQVIIQDPTFGIWTTEAETCLIKQYKKYKPLIGQSKFKSFRDMFDTIAVEMHKNGFYFSSQKCENKWRVLERKYKALSMREMMKKPGRMKHYGKWQHKKAFDEIYNEEKKNVYLEKETPEASTPKLDGNFLFAQTENGQISLSNLVTVKTNAIVLELHRISENAEINKERRHSEKMAVLKRQLEVQERLLKIKEQKLELKKASIAAMAQNIQ